VEYSLENRNLPLADVFLCLCMYVYTYVCVYVSKYICMNVSIYVRTYVCMYVCMYVSMYVCMGPGYHSRYSDSLRAGRSGDRIPVGGDFPNLSRPAWGPPSLLYKGYWVFRGEKRSRGDVDHPPHLAPRLKKE